MHRDAYPGARAVAPRLNAYFTRQAECRGSHAGPLASVPDTETIQTIIDAAFWASLRREEGFVPRISLAYLSFEESSQRLVFERPLRVDAGTLTKIAPAVERAGIHLGVWRDSNDELCVWGAARGIPRFCFVVEVAAPGLIVVKNHTEEASGKFVNVAVLEGDQIKMVNQRAGVPDDPSPLASLLGLDSRTPRPYSVNILEQLAVSMRGHGHGGSLLVVPSETESWRESILSPMPYALSPPFPDLAGLSRAEPEKARRTIDAIAGLTAVDGAVVLTDQLRVLGFGAKIMRRKGGRQVDRVRMTEPIEGGSASLVHPDLLGGTRHLSAAQFVQDQRDVVALVASQDQRFTIFKWSPGEEVVHAHRVETLLL